MGDVPSESREQGATFFTLVSRGVSRRGSFLSKLLVSLQPSEETIELFREHRLISAKWMANKKNLIIIISFQDFDLNVQAWK